MGESLCGYSELSAGRRLLDSQEQPTASVSAVSHEGAPKESQAWSERGRGRGAVFSGDEGEASGSKYPASWGWMV